MECGHEADTGLGRLFLSHCTPPVTSEGDLQGVPTPDPARHVCCPRSVTSQLLLLFLSLE